MKPDPIPEVHPITYSLWARGCLLSPFSTMAVTNAGQETLTTAVKSQCTGTKQATQHGAAIHFAAPGGVLLQGAHFSTAFPGGMT